MSDAPFPAHGETHYRRIRTKICGITRLEDALHASRLGVDALGFVFYRKSPRYIDPDRAAAIIFDLPPFITTVGLFVNPTHDDLEQVLHHCPLDMLQFHGDETPGLCTMQRLPVIKAISVSGKEDLERVASYDCPVLLDAKAPAGVYGGHGQCFDWSLLEGFDHRHELILAGGLNAANVRQALTLRPWYAVDVSSGVESAPGVKDAAAMETFVARINAPF